MRYKQYEMRHRNSHVFLKHSICAFLWIVGLPIRTAIYLFMLTCIILFLPVELLVTAYSWAYRDGYFEIILPEYFYALTVNFLIRGQWGVE